MILQHHGNTAEEPTLRIQTEGGSLTITTHLTEPRGHEITQIEICPADTASGPDRPVWHIDGPALIQLTRRDPSGDFDERPHSICGCGFELV